MGWNIAGRVLIIMPSSPSFEEQIRTYNEELRRYYAQSHAASRAEPKPEQIPEQPPVFSEPPPPEAEPIRPAEDETAPPVEQPEPEPPVERPWESVRVDEWMRQILRRPVPAEDAEPFPEEATDPLFPDEAEKDAGEQGRQAPPFGNDPPQPVEEHADTWDQADENSDVGFLQVRVFSARGAVPLVDAAVSVIGHNAAGLETLLHLSRTDASGIAPQVSLPTPDRALSYRPGDATPFLNYVVQVNAPGYATVRNERVAVYGGVTSLQSVPMIPLPEPQSDYENAVVIRPGGAPPELN